jgi:TonB family protein
MTIYSCRSVAGTALLMSLWVFCVFATEDQTPLRAMLEKARAAHNIRKSALPAFDLTGTISLLGKKNTSAQGLYRLVGTPDGQWKEELKFQGFTRVRIGDGKQFAEIQFPPSPIPALNELDSLLNFTRYLAPGKDDVLKTLKASKTAVANCVKRTSSAASEEVFCIDPQNGNLLSRAKLSPGTYGIAQADSEEFADFQSWSGKAYPRTLRSLVGKRLWIEVKLEEFKSAPVLPPEFFTVPANARSWGDCDEPSVWKLQDRVQPAYPENARRSREQGIVTLYAVIEADGTVHDLQVVHSASPSLDQSSLQAVSHWRYVPFACNGSPSRSYTYIDVVYSLMN